MAKYHFNKETGRAGKCDAKIQCRLGLDESEHFSTKEEAQSAYEKTMNSQTVQKPLKKPKNRTYDIDNHVFDTDVIGFGELRGKKASEIRKYINDVHNQHHGKEEKLKEDIAQTIGLDRIPGFNDYGTYVALDRDGYLIVEQYAAVPYDEDNNIDYSYDDAYTYLDHDYVNIDEHVDSTLTIAGYYNDDSYTRSRYRVPDEFQDDLEGLKEFDKYEPYHSKASNPELPDWASIPTSITMDDKPKRNNNLTNKAVKPSDPSNRIKKLNKIINNDKEIQRLEKANKVLLKRSNEAVEKLHEIRDYEKSNNKKGFVFDKNPEYRGLSQSGRKRQKTNIENSINRFNNDYLRNDRKIQDAENITQADKSQASVKVQEINKEYDEKSREYKIDKLSDLYPHSNPSVRTNQATSWVDNHPDLSVDDF